MWLMCRGGQQGLVLGTGLAGAPLLLRGEVGLCPPLTARPAWPLAGGLLTATSSRWS